nr:unnamed protein product [Digitaria exilis]
MNWEGSGNALRLQIHTVCVSSSSSRRPAVRGKQDQVVVRLPWHRGGVAPLHLSSSSSVSPSPSSTFKPTTDWSSLVAIDDRFHSPLLPLRPPPARASTSSTAIAIARAFDEQGKGRASTMVRLPYSTALTTLFSYGLLFAFGHLRDFFRRIIDSRKPTTNLKVRCQPLLPSCLPALPLLLCLTPAIPLPQDYAPICLGHEDFYTRRLFNRVQVRRLPRFNFQNNNQ